MSEYRAQVTNKVAMLRGGTVGALARLADLSPSTASGYMRGIQTDEAIGRKMSVVADELIKLQARSMPFLLPWDNLVELRALLEQQRSGEVSDFFLVRFSGYYATSREGGQVLGSKERDMALRLSEEDARNVMIQLKRAGHKEVSIEPISSEAGQ